MFVVKSTLLQDGLTVCYGDFPTKDAADKWANKFFYEYEVLVLKPPMEMT